MKVEDYEEVKKTHEANCDATTPSVDGEEQTENQKGNRNHSLKEPVEFVQHQKDVRGKYEKE